MRIVCALFMLLVGVVANAADQVSTGGGLGVVQDSYPGSCGTLIFSADGTYENAYAWQYGGVVAPLYGAFAERFDSAGLIVCGIVMDLTQTGNDAGQTCDLYVWEDAGGLPGMVLALSTSFEPASVAVWPILSQHFGRVTSECGSTDATWIGYWGNWPGQATAWFVGADLDGLGGKPYTNIAPGIGYPTGWNHVSVVWGPTQAIGLGAEVVECPHPPVKNASWGEVKGLYR